MTFNVVQQRMSIQVCYANPIGHSERLGSTFDIKKATDYLTVLHENGL
jgi:hypothetical protein